MTSVITIPKRPRGRPSAKINAQFGSDLADFCDEILKISSRLDFRVSSRGWCYLLEEHGLGKGDFDHVQSLINDCRKTGALPLDICAEDGSRVAINVDDAEAWENSETIEDEVEWELNRIENARQSAIEAAGNDYKPHAFWFGQDYYLELLVEKIDLKELFSKICRRFRIPLGNSRGWPDINSRAKMMERFGFMERQGKQCALLYCGDHDPAGLQISESLRSMFWDLSGAVGWHPDDLIIDRFGLNSDLIAELNLTWIEGLETGSGRNLEDPRHPDHGKPYVQDYLTEYGPRKVEANALVVRPDAGRELCLDAITKHVDADAPQRYEQACRDAQQEIKSRVLAELGEDE
jgi:hypothetical protein